MKKNAEASPTGAPPPEESARVRTPRKRFTKDTIALVYDFDGTLSPQPMQEYTVLPKIGEDPAQFWREVKEETAREGEEPMLTYMRLLLEKAEAKKVHIGRNDFVKLANQVEYFPGVETWFDRIGQFTNDVAGNGIKLHHYIISAGLKEILEGVSIRKYFANIFASEYHYNHHGVATFPKLLVNDTAKTQFLFRINKGREHLTDSINGHMPVEQRPIPFENIIYIGDGETDVPCMAVTRQNHGNALAVYPPGKSEAAQRKKRDCESLLKVGRVNFIAVADYSAGSLLEARVHLLLKSVIARIEYQRELFKCRRDHGLDA